MTLIVLTLAACEPKAAETTQHSETNSDSGDPSTGGSVDGSWALGSYFRPGNGAPTAELATIVVNSDHTADLHVETCRGDEPSMFKVRWEESSDDAIEFKAIEEGEPLRWYGSIPFGGAVTLSRTDESNVVRVTDGETVDNYSMGDFSRTSKPICLVVTNAALGCGDGSYAQACSDS